MTLTPVTSSAIARTPRGLTINGTRITLYEVMDHLAAGRSPEVILNWLPLSEVQLQVALDYIEANQAEVEAEYQTVLQTAEEIRQYWQEQNRDRLAIIAALPVPPEKAALWEKLQIQKARTAAEQ
jgi:uncharacterized protein (DUF433 family)